MEKVIREGKVAVIYSGSFGAGWYTWNDEYRELLYHPQFVQKIEDDEQKDITEEWVRAVLNLSKDTHVCTLAVGKLSIKWLPVGTAFRIEEFDGSEEIITELELLEIA